MDTMVSLLTGMFVSALQIVVTQQMEVINVTGAVGFRQNITVFAVNDSVTWYTAREACSEVIPGTEFSMRGQGYWHYIARAISQIDGLSDPLLWISRIKSNDDNVVYHGDTCKNDTELTIIHSTDTPTNEPTCFVLDTANPASSHALDDCLNKHPYICVKNSKDNTQRDEHNNVMVTPDSQIEVKVMNGISTHDKCIRECDWRFACIATIFTESLSTCERLTDTSLDLHAMHVLSLSNSSSENVFQAKPGKRASIEILEPSTSRTLYETPVYSCTIPSMTSTETTLTCDCSCPHTMTVNSSELKEWIENITRVLTVNNKQLSSFTRRLTSAEDPRPSSRAFGAFGVVIISTVILYIVGGDIVTFVASVKKRFTRKSKIFELYEQ